MFFTFVTPRMLVLHPVISTEVFIKRQFIKDSIDRRVIKALKVRYWLKDVNYLDPFMERVFDKMLKMALTSPGHFLINYVRARLGFSLSSSIKSICKKLKTDLNSSIEADRFLAQIICSFFSNFYDLPKEICGSPLN